MGQKILFSNLGYARGIDGSLMSHMRNIHRHFYAGLPVQKKVLAQLKEIIALEDPDLCCFVEIDAGSLHSANYNQIQSLLDEKYAFHDIAGKYGQNSTLGRMPLHAGKSNGFIAKREMAFETVYFKCGTKRLIYKITLPGEVTLFFAHFSLSRDVRQRQLLEMRALIEQAGGDCMVLADFNILHGFGELKPLLLGADLKVLNREDEPTFTFHLRRHTLDLCICSGSLAERARLRIIPQPFSDHAALLVEV